MLLKNCTLALAVGAAALLMANNNANAVTLDSLLAGGTLSVGNFTFSNFTYGGTTPSASVVVNTSATGLAFTTNTAGWTTPTGNSVISYDVTANSGAAGSVGLGFTATASTGASAFVGETVTDLANGNKKYNLQVFTDGPGGLADSLTSSVDLTPASTHLHVTKSIDVAANGGAATITLVDNTFSPTGGTGEGPVPEPMSLALLPLALMGLGLRRKLAR